MRDKDPLATAVLTTFPKTLTAKMPSAASLKSKQAYNDRLCALLDNHTRAFIVGADNVGSRQFMDIRAVRAHSPSTPHPVAPGLKN